jgi:hypothetical protein
MMWLVPSSGGLDLTGQKEMGFLVSPLSHLSPVKRFNLPFAIDNGAFGDKFNHEKYLALLAAAQPYRDRCLFVVAPDVVGDSGETTRRWHEWLPVLRQTGYPLAYVAQDGLIEPPWDEMDALFIGGSTEYKLSDQVLQLLAAAGERGLWRHIGRVNSRKRLRHFWDRAESFDGTDWCRGPAIKLRFYQWAMAQEAMQGRWTI